MQASTQVQHTEVSNKWKMRDFITLAIFNVVMLIVITIVGMIAHPLGYLVGGGLTALLNGPIYMVMSNKIGKRGILLFSALILGLYFVAFGYVQYLIILTVFGVICELVMWGSDTYRDPLRNACGYGLYYVSYSLCGVLPLIFFRDQYMAVLKLSYTPSKLENMLYYYETPSMVILMCICSFVGAFAGCMAGKALLKKHVKKAKLV